MLTIQEEVNFDTALTAPVIRVIESRLGRPALIKLVCAVFKLFLDSMNISHTMTALQVYELAQLWIEQYPTDSLKDLILCLKRVKMGKYGKIYNRLDVEVISEFWAMYLIEKAEYRENQHRLTKAREASNEKLMLQQISTHAPNTARLLKTFIRPTPVLSSPDTGTHESYLRELSERLPFLSHFELNSLRDKAMQSGKQLIVIIELIDSEIDQRKQEIPYQEL